MSDMAVVSGTGAIVAHDIKALLSLYDEAYTEKFGVRAPIVPGRDAALAKGLLGRYTLAQLTDWLGVFFILHDPFVQQSGYGFHMFVTCLGKCITAKPKPLAPQPPPPEPLVELAKSIARRRAEESADEQAAIAQLTQQYRERGLSDADAVFEATRDWLRKARA